MHDAPVWSPILSQGLQPPCGRRSVDDEPDDLGSLREQVRVLEGEVEALRRRLDGADPANRLPAPLPDLAASPERSPGRKPSEGNPSLARRRFLRGASAVAAGATGAMALDLARPTTASAATVVGNGNPGVRGYGTGGDGVVGTTDTGGASGVYGYALTGAVGTTGRNLGNSNAVEGIASGAGTGVYGYSAAGIGMEAASSGTMALWAHSDSIGLGVTGNRAAIWIDTTGSTQPSLLTDFHTTGEIYRHYSGDLWYCVAAGVPGEWRKLAGTQTAGSLHVLASTARVYDSRPGFPPLGVAKGVLANGAERLVNCSPALMTKPLSIAVNLTVTDTSSSGWLAAFRGDVAYPGNSTINWSQPGSIVANSAVVALNPASSEFKVKISGSSYAHFVVDVVGYYE